VTSIVRIDEHTAWDQANWLFQYVLDEVQVELRTPGPTVDPELARTLLASIDDDSAANVSGYLDLQVWPVAQRRLFLEMLERVSERKPGEWKPSTLAMLDELIAMVRAHVSSVPA
jgi:hypothetical protein